MLNLEFIQVALASLPCEADGVQSVRWEALHAHHIIRKQSFSDEFGASDVRFLQADPLLGASSSFPFGSPARPYPPASAARPGLSLRWGRETRASPDSSQEFRVFPRGGLAVGKSGLCGIRVSLAWVASPRKDHNSKGLRNDYGPARAGRCPRQQIKHGQQAISKAIHLALSSCPALYLENMYRIYSRDSPYLPRASS